MQGGIVRTGVESPYSLFLNRKGFSYCTVNKQQYKIETDTYLFTQPGDIYDLIIDNIDQTEICNIHINRDFFSKCTHAYTTGSNRLLDNEDQSNDTPDVFTRLYRKDDHMLCFIEQLSSMDITDKEAFELLLHDMISHILLSHEAIKRNIALLPFIKTTVKTEIYKRLAWACDFIHSNYQQPLSPL